MKKAVKIMAKRDDITEAEAKEIINDTLDEVLSAVEDGDYALAEDIWLDDTGLDLDDLLDMLL